MCKKSSKKSKMSKVTPYYGTIFVLVDSKVLQVFNLYAEALNNGPFAVAGA